MRPENLHDSRSQGKEIRCPGCGAMLAKRLGDVLQIRHGRRVYTIRGGVLESVYCPGCGGTSEGEGKETEIKSDST